MEFVQEISLELNSNTAYTTVGAKQGDSNSRVINVHITSNGEDYNLEEQGVSSAYFRFRKPDGKAIINTVTIDKENNILKLVLTAQTLAVSGRGYADITLLSGSTILSTVSFIIIIMSSPQVAGEATSSNEFGLLNAVVEDATHTIYEAEAWAAGTRGGNEVFGNNSFTVTKTSEIITAVSVDESTFKQQVGSRPGLKRIFTFQYTTDNNWKLILKTIEGVTEVESPPEVINSLTDYGIVISLLGGQDTPNPNDTITVAVEEADNAYENNAKYYAQQAAASKSSVDNLTIIAHTIPNEEPATVSKTTVDDHLQFDFGIPKGDTGNVNFMTFDIDVDTNSPTCGQILMYRPTEISRQQLDFQIIDSGDNTGWLGVIINTEVVTNA